ncbi:MAG: DJ-1/PfpI family protein [Gammaproteobacteria bacterium]|nr:DJ-1/PfpI family protein [Gammaproteobacteria bacterium]
MNIGIYLYPDVEALDFAGPFEVFTTASRVRKRLHPRATEPFSVFSIAESRAPVRARAGLHIIPDHTIDEHPPIQVLIVPGGVITAELEKQNVLDWVVRTADCAERVASVCTGAFILAKAGVIQGGPVTTHWEDQAELAEMFPALEVLNGPRWVEQGSRITSAGIAAGIDMSLHLVSCLCAPSLALATAQQMDYPWNAYRVPSVHDA